MTSAVLDLAFLMPNMKNGSQLSIGRVFTNPSNTLTFEITHLQSYDAFRRPVRMNFVHLFRNVHSVPFPCVFALSLALSLLGFLSDIRVFVGRSLGSHVLWYEQHCAYLRPALQHQLHVPQRHLFCFLGEDGVRVLQFPLPLTPPVPFAPFSPPPLTCTMNPSGSFASRLNISMASKYSSIYSATGVRSFKTFVG